MRAVYLFLATESKPKEAAQSGHPRYPRNPRFTTLQQRRTLRGSLLVRWSV